MQVFCLASLDWMELGGLPFLIVFSRCLFGLHLKFLIHLLAYDFIHLKNTNWD